jgi:two-component system cell cycle sensor histidine kinase PleC
MQGGSDTIPPHHRPRAKDPRAAVQVHIRELRARFSQGTVLKPEFEYELLSMFVRNELSARVTIPLLAVIFSLASMFWAPVLHASAWLATVISMKFFMIAACLRFQALPRGEMRVDTWRKTFIWLELGSGIAWGGMAVVGLGTADTASLVFMLTSLIVLLAIRMTFASAVMTILYVGTIPMSWRFAPASHAGTPLYLAMAAMAVSHVYFIALARGLTPRHSCWSSAPKGCADRRDRGGEIDPTRPAGAEAANVANRAFSPP